MRLALPVLFILFFSLNIALGAEKPPFYQESSIERVTVFLQGATIERKSQVYLKTGVNELVFNNLSPDVMESSIQVSGLKDAAVLSIQFNYNYLDKKAESAEYKTLDSALDKLLFRQNEIKNTIEGFNQELNLLTKNDRVNSDNTDLDLENVKQIAMYYRERTIEIKNNIYIQQQELVDLEKDIQDHRSELQKLDSTRKERRGEITLKLQAEKSTALDLEISYIIENAGWFPVYDIKAANTSAPIALEYNANVYQQSGIDWENVNLVLSTGDPYTDNLKPQLEPKYLNFVSRNYRSSTAVNRSNLKYNPTIHYVSGNVKDESGQPLPGVTVVENGTSNGTATDFDGDYSLQISNGKSLAFSYIGYTTEEIPVYASRMNVQLEENQESLDEVVVIGYGQQNKSAITGLSGKVAGVQIRGASSIKEAPQYNENVQNKKESLTNTRFEIKKRYTIASNPDITTIEIDNFELPASYQHYAAPELNENVFLTATITNWEKYDLLQGEANIYFEGSYAGKTQINPVATSDSLQLSLGVDPNIIVTREKQDNFKSKSFLGGSKIVAKGYKIEVKNNKTSTINLLLEDRIPISQNKEIKVSEIETRDAIYKEESGIMQWKLEISSKGTVSKEFSYEVRYPRGQYINL
ncbi:MAG: mucoidy inhibitor MuiA family protein [Leeuwenhoekiella sp.]